MFYNKNASGLKAGGVFRVEKFFSFWRGLICIRQADGR